MEVRQHRKTNNFTLFSYTAMFIQEITPAFDEHAMVSVFQAMEMFQGKQISKTTVIHSTSNSRKVF